MAETRRERPCKRRWARPRLSTQKLYERDSLACGKSTPDTSQCFRRGRVS